MNDLFQNVGSMFLNTLLEPAAIINTQGIIEVVNQSWVDFSIYNTEKFDAFLGRSYFELYPVEIELKAGIIRVLNADIKIFRRRIDCNTNGERRTFIIRVTPLEDKRSGILGALLVYFDVTDQNKIEKILKTGLEQYRLIAQYSNDMIKVTDTQGNVEYASPSHQKVLGFTENSNIFEIIHPEDKEKLVQLTIEVKQTKEPKYLEMRKQHKNGNWIWVESVISPVLTEEGDLHKFILITRDISDRKHLEQELRQLAFHDPLTNLFNRRKMKIIFDETYEEKSKYGGKFAVLIMDLDKFKKINDTYGHDIGDFVLKEFSNRLLQNKGEADIVGRLSGDEFAVLMKHINGIKDIEKFIQRFQKSLLVPCVVAHLDSSIQMKSSIGYAIYPDHGDSLKQLFKHADTALYKEKKKRIHLGKRMLKKNRIKQIRLA